MNDANEASSFYLSLVKIDEGYAVAMKGPADDIVSPAMSLDDALDVLENVRSTVNAFLRVMGIGSIQMEVEPN